MKILNTCRHVTGGLKNFELFSSPNQMVKESKKEKMSQSSPIKTKTDTGVDHYAICLNTSVKFVKIFITFFGASDKPKNDVN